jgi:hypothetical protein
MNHASTLKGQYSSVAITILMALFLILGGCGSARDDADTATTAYTDDTTGLSGAAKSADTAGRTTGSTADEHPAQQVPQDSQSPDSNQIPGGQDDFWVRLQAHCGEAFEGRLVTAAPGFDLLDGSERLVVHFRSCSDFESRLPFHIEEGPDAWDRSRTWVFFNHGADGLELRHDHRHQDGSEEDNTWYGGHAIEGGPYWQRFVYPPRTEEMGVFMGWRVEIHPDERFTYGTMRGDEWTFRVDFDLSQSVEAPPPPWGFY